jgi:hypothetical protein
MQQDRKAMTEATKKANHDRFPRKLDFLISALVSPSTSPNLFPVMGKSHHNLYTGLREGERGPRDWGLILFPIR